MMFAANKEKIPYQQLKEKHTISQFQVLERSLRRVSVSLLNCNSMLDFGCGYGRLTEMFLRFAKNAEIYACDIREDYLKLAKKSLPEVNFIQNKEVPPLEIKDGTFDLIFAYSVFSHLREDHHIAWLSEFQRLLKKGGILALSTHGYECLNRLEVFNPIRLKDYLIDDLGEFTTNNSGYHWVQDNPKEDSYGLAVIPKQYVENNWSRYSGLILKDYFEGAFEAYPEGCQDLVIMRKD